MDEDDPELEPESLDDSELEPESLELSTIHVSPTVESPVVPAVPTQKPSLALHVSPSQHDASSMHQSASASSGTHDGTHTGAPMPAAP